MTHLATKLYVIEELKYRQTCQITLEFQTIKNFFALIRFRLKIFTQIGPFIWKICHGKTYKNVHLIFALGDKKYS